MTKQRGPGPESTSAIERLISERPTLREFCRVDVDEVESFYVVQVPAPIDDHGDLCVSTADDEFTVSFDKWHRHHNFDETGEVLGLVDGIMEERLVVTVKILDGKWNGSTIHARKEPPSAWFEELQGEAYTRSWRGTYDSRPPAIAMLPYERWASYDSYAYLSVCDGPDDESDHIAPFEEPPPGDPKLYSLDRSEFTAAVGVQPTRVARRGDRRHFTGRYEMRNLWELRSVLPNDAAPHEHVKSILAQVKPLWGMFVEVSRPYFVIMHVVSKGTNPGLALDQPEVEMLAQIRAGMDIDMYPDGGDEDAIGLPQRPPPSP